MGKYEKLGSRIGSLVDEKNMAYGDSFSKSCQILAILYPNGIVPRQFQDILTIVRVIDKLFRIATMKKYNGESPWQDIAGYSILATASDEANKEIECSYVFPNRAIVPQLSVFARVISFSRSIMSRIIGWL